MSRKITKLGASLAVLAAVAVGASAIAGAASNTSSSTSTTKAQAAPSQNGYGPPPGGSRPQHKPETRLTGDTAAAEVAPRSREVSGGKIIRVGADSDSELSHRGPRYPPADGPRQPGRGPGEQAVPR